MKSNDVIKWFLYEFPHLDTNGKCFPSPSPNFFFCQETMLKIAGFDNNSSWTLLYNVTTKLFTCIFFFTTMFLKAVNCKTQHNMMEG